MADESWRPADLAEAAWFAAIDADGGWTGYDPGGRPDAVWILHAMYEWASGATTTTHDDVHRELLDAGLTERFVVGDVDLDAATVVIGGDLGRSQHPGEGWRRLRWGILADRLGEPAVPPGLRPCFRCLPGAHPSGSWPASIEPPAEGSLDREGWYRLVDLLTCASPEGAATRCLAYFSPAQSGGDPEGGRLLAFDRRVSVVTVAERSALVTQHAAAAASAAPSGPGGGAVEVQRLLASGRLSRAAGLARVVSAAEQTVEAGTDRTLPVRAELRPLLPGKGLRRGATITVAGATSLLFALLGHASQAGAWICVVGAPNLGVAAAAEAGVLLERFALVPDLGPDWAAVVASLIEGLDVVAVR